MSENPFAVGDRVRFQPSKRTIGWVGYWLDEQGLYAGKICTVTSIEGPHIGVDDMTGPELFWTDFRAAADSDDGLRLPRDPPERP